MKITKAGKSGMIRCNVPRLSVADEADMQKDNIVKGINVAKNLFEWYHQIVG